MTDIALDKRAKFAAQLRNAANEMRAEDHNGWPVLCDIVADYLDASPSQVAPANQAQVTDAMVEHMVQQFLRWKLPDDFNPDGGISFDPIMNLGTEHQSRREPVGTNLFDYQQAKAMVHHMLEGLSAAIGAGGQAVAVKPLEWEETKGNYEGQAVWSPKNDAWPCWVVKNPDTDHYVWCEELGIELVPASPVKGTYPTLETAKAAAQADYERRILSALSQPHPADERMVEAAIAVLKWLDGGCSSWGVPEQQIRILALSAKECR